MHLKLPFVLYRAVTILDAAPTSQTSIELAAIPKVGVAKYKFVATPLDQPDAKSTEIISTSPNVVAGHLIPGER